MSCSNIGHPQLKKALIMNDKLTSEEIEILEAFENGELRSVPNVEREIEWAQEAARRTLARNSKAGMVDQHDSPKQR